WDEYREKRTYTLAEPETVGRVLDLEARGLLERHPYPESYGFDDSSHFFLPSKRGAELLVELGVDVAAAWSPGAGETARERCARKRSVRRSCASSRGRSCRAWSSPRSAAPSSCSSGADRRSR